MPVALPPWDDVTLQPSSATLCGHLGRTLLDERDEVGVGDLLLLVGQRDGLAVDRVERLALEVVAELAQLALQAAPAGQLADRERLPASPTDWGVMISYVSGFLITPSWWMPDSWAKALPPTIALLGWTAKPVR